MFEKLKKYLNDYSKEIDEQPQQEYDKSLRDLWEKNAKLAGKILGHLNKRYMSLHRIEDIPEEYRESYKDRANYMSDKMVLIGFARYSFSNGRFLSKDCPSETVAHRDYYLDVLKSILSENYKPPKEIEGILDHLLTLSHLYAYLMPTTPGLSHIIPLRAGYALALLAGSALIKSSIADEKGHAEYRFTRQGKTGDKKKADMLDLISKVCDGLTIDKYRTADGKIRYYSMAGEIQKRFKEDEKIKKQLVKIDKRYKNGTKIPNQDTIVKYLEKIDLENPKRLPFRKKDSYINIL